ncbi:unknown [Clostridium sp. CAG:729]|nr:unknown [Clostridium sp. CAG:729]
MKKYLVWLLIIAGIPVWADEIQLGDVHTQKIEIPKADYKSKQSLVVKDEQILSELIRLQKEKDLEDIENLWKGTVENNQVIGFALKKLSTPESQRRIHSSLMAKTLSAVVAGASFAPSLVGADYLTQTSAFAAGRLAQNLINRKNIPTEIPLTDTELIELAGLVESLQDKIITAYYNYKSSLSQLKESRQRLLLYNKNYAKALDDEDLMEITISSALYDNMRIEEFYYMETAKKYHLELQRLAGKKVVDRLNLYQYNYNSTLVGEKAAGGK